MIKTERLVNNFLEMLNKESPSLNELSMGQWLIEYFNKMEIEAYMDNSAAKIGGNCGNIIAHIKGDSKFKPLGFLAHMDQVEPCRNINARIDKNFIKTDGTTTLGGDDKAGIAVILEALKHILEEKLIHREMYLIFTVCEEAGLKGSRYLEIDKEKLEDIIIIDAAGPSGILAYKAPAMSNIEVIFRGKKAHAGIEPEKGINAIQVAANAIALMHIGRIDFETTSNIGRIEGGSANNIVTDEVKFTAEIRSHSMDKLISETNYMRKCCEDVSDNFKAKCDFTYTLEFPSFELSQESNVYKICEKAFIEEGIKFKPMVIGGGSDANILSGRGFNCAIISTGMDKVHTLEETLSINDMVNTAKAIARMMTE